MNAVRQEGWSSRWAIVGVLILAAFCVIGMLLIQADQAEYERNAAKRMAAVAGELDRALGEWVTANGRAPTFSEVVWCMGEIWECQDNPFVAGRAIELLEIDSDGRVAHGHSPHTLAGHLGLRFAKSRPHVVWWDHANRPHEVAAADSIAS